MILPIILIVNLITSSAAYSYVGETPCTGLSNADCTLNAISGKGYCFWES